MGIIMNTDKITCPECKAEIPITEAIQGQIEGRIKKEYDLKWETRDSALKEREQLASNREKDLVIERESFDVLVSNQVNEKLESERKTLELKIRGEEQSKVDLDMAELKSTNETQKKTLGVYKDKILDAQKKQIEVIQDKENLEIEYQEKLTKERVEIKQEVTGKMDEKYRLQMAEKDKMISDTNIQLEEAKRKLNQGSQQLQGEVLELELEQILKSNFPHDDIVPIPKGVKGADVLQKIITPSGESCGTIIWESKRTKTWSDSWIKKLKDDQLEQKADLAIIYSTILPKGIENFTVVDDVWIISRNFMVPIATALRSGIIDVARSRTVATGKNQKMKLLFSYLTGKEFGQRVGVILQTYIEMKKQLDQEKRAINRIWSKREKQIESVQTNLAAMYGGLEEIVGASLPQLKALELTALPDSSSIESNSTSEDNDELPS